MNARTVTIATLAVVILLCAALWLTGVIGGSDAAPAPRAVPVANVSKWIKSIEDSERIGVRQLACMKLGELGPAASEAIPTLEDAAAKDESEKIREAGQQALAKIRGG